MRPEADASIKAAKKLAFMMDNPNGLSSDERWRTLEHSQRFMYLHRVHELMKILDYNEHYKYWK